MTFKTPLRGARKRTFIDMRGRRIGKLVVVREAPATSGVRWLCDCDCGGTHITLGAYLRSARKRGIATSCPECKGRAST